MFVVTIVDFESTEQASEWYWRTLGDWLMVTSVEQIELLLSANILL